MSEKKSGELEFKILNAKSVGSDTVSFRLEDGALVKCKVDIDRAGIAKDYTNPDGTPHYNVRASIKVSVTPPKKTFFGPKPKLPPLPKRNTQLKPI